MCLQILRNWGLTMWQTLLRKNLEAENQEVIKDVCWSRVTGKPQESLVFMVSKIRASHSTTKELISQLNERH